MADMTAIRNAIASAITTRTGLRADGQARDLINPPCAVVLPGQPYITYAATMDGALDFRFTVLVIMSDAAPVEQTQRALDTYLGVGSGTTTATSVPNAIEADPTLGGLLHILQVNTVGRYGRIEYAGVSYFGASLNLVAGGI